MKSNTRILFILIILLAILLVGIINFGKKDLKENRGENFEPRMEESEEVEKTEISLDTTNVVNSNTIDLEQYDTDIMINKAGTYRLSGNFTHAIIVNAPLAEVTLELNGVTITNSETAAIIALDAKLLTITTIDNTINTLTDGGASQYDGCIFSQAELVLEGKGSLIVNGEQTEGEGIATEAKNITINGGIISITSKDDGMNAGGDGATITINNGTIYINASGDGIDSNKNAIINGGTIFVMGSDVTEDSGIDTDEGYVINGGTVVALGNAMLEMPETTSTQISASWQLENYINANTLVSLVDSNGTEVISFQANKKFKTIIISTNDLTNTEYSLYTGGTHTGVLSYGLYLKGEYEPGSKVSINNTDTYTLSKIVNSFGNTNR